MRAAWRGVRASRPAGTWQSAIPTELSTTTAPDSATGSRVCPEIHSGSPVDSIAQHSDSTAVTPTSAQYGRSRSTDRRPPRARGSGRPGAGTPTVITASARNVTTLAAMASRYAEGWSRARTSAPAPAPAAYPTCWATRWPASARTRAAGSVTRPATRTVRTAEPPLASATNTTVTAGTPAATRPAGSRPCGGPDHGQRDEQPARVEPVGERADRGRRGEPDGPGHRHPQPDGGGGVAEHAGQVERPDREPQPVAHRGHAAPPQEPAQPEVRRCPRHRRHADHPSRVRER